MSVRIVPGVHSVAEVFKVRPKSIKELWVREGATKPELLKFLELATTHKVPISRKGARAMDAIVASHQGVIAVVDGRPEWPSFQELKSKEAGLILALDSIGDPHNVGSILRSSWNLGVLGVMYPKDRTPGDAPAAQKVASGGFEHVPIMEVSNLHAELQGLKDCGFWIYGLDRSASGMISDTELAKKSVVVLGAEESGLRKTTISACDGLLSIPQVSDSDSYNAAVAGALAGYEYFRQHGLFRISQISRKKL